MRHSKPSLRTRKRAPYDPERMRNRLLDVAATAFQSRGYHATSMHDIMRLAGVSGGALHHHFPSKKSLGLAVIGERVAREVAASWIEPLQSARSGAAGVAAAFAGIIAGLDERGAVMGCPLNNLAHELALADPEFRTALRIVFENWRAAIAEKLRADRVRASGLGPDQLATFVVAVFSGAMSMAKAGQETAPLKACAELVMRTLRPRTRRRNV